MIWITVLIALATGSVVQEIPTGSGKLGRIACEKHLPQLAADYNNAHPTQQVRAECREENDLGARSAAARFGR
jgi:hypothetical protein